MPPAASATRHTWVFPELDVWQQRLAELGIEHPPVTDAPSGSGTAFVFRDPDDIQLEFWWSPPRR
jgi:hypothetical protein